MNHRELQLSGNTLCRRSSPMEVTHLKQAPQKLRCIFPASFADTTAAARLMAEMNHLISVRFWSIFLNIPFTFLPILFCVPGV
jgi:hypothetical protein